MSNQYRNEQLHPSIIGRLNPYDGDLNTESWRFSQYVEGLENKYLTRGLGLDAKVRFLLALVPDQLLASAKTALIAKEQGYLLDNLYQSMTWTEELDTNLFYAPACR